MSEPELTVGRIVHVIRFQKCYMAATVDVTDDGPLLKIIAAGITGINGDERHEAYNSWHSARPTSGWHWPQEHEDGNIEKA